LKNNRKFAEGWGFASGSDLGRPEPLMGGSPLGALFYGNVNVLKEKKKKTFVVSAVSTFRSPASCFQNSGAFDQLQSFT